MGGLHFVSAAQQLHFAAPKRAAFISAALLLCAVFLHAAGAPIHYSRVVARLTRKQMRAYLQEQARGEKTAFLRGETKGSKLRRKMRIEVDSRDGPMGINPQLVDAILYL